MKLRSWTRTLGVVSTLAWAIGASPTAPAAGIGSRPGFAVENGDVDGDFDRDLADALGIVRGLFLGGPASAPLALCGTAAPAVRNGDVNGDGAVRLNDALRLLGWLFGVAPAPVRACGIAVRVLPPDAAAYGESYGEWSARWWQWAFGLPATGHPLFDETGELAGSGQSGPVFFLAGVFNASGVVSREISIEPGQSLLVPIINVECSTVEPPPFFGAGEAELRACVEQYFGAGDELSGELDGVALEDLRRFRFQSPLFQFTTPPADDLLGMPGVTAGSVSDGYWLYFAPLPVGTHALHVRGAMGGGPIAGFSQDLSYTIHVVE